MRIEEATYTIATLFNDPSSAWVPSTALVVGFVIMHLGPVHLQPLFKSGGASAAVLTFAGVPIDFGHPVLGL